MRSALIAIVLLVSGMAGTLNAMGQTNPVPSTCLAVAQNLHTPDLPVHFASFQNSTPIPVYGGKYTPVSSGKYDVEFSFQGHSTYLIKSPSGVSAATDYAGWLAEPIVPDVVTMNRAHASHYTDFPNPKIKHVLKGWGSQGDIARHHVVEGDMLVRNVTTDLLRFNSLPDGNSIFIFEVGGLCIGHLGHLHHKLSEDHYAKIGRLDVVMVPIDGGLTMSHVSAKEIVARLRSSVILPMHVRSYDALPTFLSYMGSDFPVERLKKNKLVLSLTTLPEQPTIMLLPGVGDFFSPDE